MMRSMFSAVSGLRNHQTRMDVIGNNIANVNTIGYKGSRVNFQDILSQTVQGAAQPQGNRGGTNPMQIGLGVGVASIDTIFTDGSTQSTGKQSDLALQGQGFFIINDGAKSYYTRAGNFDFDTAGNYIVPGTGLKVQGWTAVNGVIDTNGPVGNIQVPVGTSIPADPTEAVTYSKNLDSTETDVVPTSVKVYDSLGTAHIVNVSFYKPTTSINVANSVFDTQVGPPAATHTQNFSLVDANGQTHDIAVTITTASATTWNYTVTDVASGTTLATAAGQAIGTFTGGINVAANAGAGTQAFTLNFPSATAGTYAAGTTTYGTAANTWQWRATSTDPTMTIAAGGGPNTLTFTGAGAFSVGNGNLTLNFTNGANNGQAVSLNLSGLTQYASETTANGVGDGYASGTLQTVTLDTSGVITGVFSNGISRSLAQVALATFNNPGGLLKAAENKYEESNNSGIAQVGTANSGGRGKISPGSLEMSNVDLSQQFTDMIVTQRGFQANSKIITASDEMLQDLVNLKR